MAVPAEWTETVPADSFVVSAAAICPRPPPLSADVDDLPGVSHACGGPLEGPAPFAGQPVGEQRNEIENGGARREPVSGVVHQLRDLR